jgi:hypothetical protein
MKLKDILNEIEISRGTTIEIVGDQIIVNGSPLKRLDIAYVGMSDRVYRGYLHTDKGQTNLSGGQRGLDEFYDAINYNYQRLGITLNDFLKKYGVEVTSSEFDVS